MLCAYLITHEYEWCSENLPSLPRAHLSWKWVSEALPGTCQSWEWMSETLLGACQSWEWMSEALPGACQTWEWKSERDRLNNILNLASMLCHLTILHSKLSSTNFIEDEIKVKRVSCLVVIDLPCVACCLALQTHHRRNRTLSQSEIWMLVTITMCNSWRQYQSKEVFAFGMCIKCPAVALHGNTEDIFGKCVNSIQMPVCIFMYVDTELTIPDPNPLIHLLRMLRIIA